MQGVGIITEITVHQIFFESNVYLVKSPPNSLSFSGVSKDTALIPILQI